MHPVICATVLLCAVVRTAGIPLGNTAKVATCRVTGLHFLRNATCSRVPSHVDCWSIQLSNGVIRALHNGSVPSSTLSQFIAHVGCRGDECVPVRAPCFPFAARTPGDPSDALWLQRYNSGESLVVVATIGTVALLFFVAAIVCEGTIFQPRRIGVARAPLAMLTLLALSAFLQLVLVPREWQPALLGGGARQSALYIVLVIVGAVLLPAVTLLLQMLAVLYVNFLLLVVRIVFWTVLGIVQLSAGLVYLHVAWFVLQVLARYRPVLPQWIATGDRDLLYYAREFWRMREGNTLLRRIPHTVDEVCRMVLRATLDPQMYERLVGMQEEEHSDDEVEYTEITPLV